MMERWINIQLWRGGRKRISEDKGKVEEESDKKKRFKYLEEWMSMEEGKGEKNTCAPLCLWRIAVLSLFSITIQMARNIIPLSATHEFT